MPKLRVSTRVAALVALVVSAAAPTRAQTVTVDLSLGPTGDIGSLYTDPATGLQASGMWCDDDQAACIGSSGVWHPADLWRVRNPNGIDLGLGVCDPHEGSACATGRPNRAPGEFNELSDGTEPEIMYLTLPAGYRWVSVEVASLDDNSTDGGPPPERGVLWADVDTTPNNGNASFVADYSGSGNEFRVVDVPQSFAASPHLFLHAFDFTGKGGNNNDHLVYRVTLSRMTPTCDRGCDDENPCTTDSCDAGVCHNPPIPGCTACTIDADCDDGNPCTTQACGSDGRCEFTPIADCVPCRTDTDCDDGKPCTSQACGPNGTCEFTSIPGCPCTSDADCDDGNPCTSHACGSDGTCQVTPIPGCQRCEVAADCDDGDRCTNERCTGGVCGHDQVPQCEPAPENCTDGVDNDGDGLIDCADSDCADAPNCRPREICGNCLDDDGDGLIDGEDSDCCAQPIWMAVKRLALKPGSGAVHGNRLRLKTRYPVQAALFDPATQDASVQLRDANGELFCTTVAAKNWKHPKRPLYRFKDKPGTFAGGLALGRFKLKRSGKVTFATRGKKMSIRPTTGENVMIVVRVGAQCAKEMRTLRATKKGLVFP